MQIKSKIIEKQDQKTPPRIEDCDIHLEITPIVPDIATIAPPKSTINQQKGFFSLNRTHSTEGIASKVSLELKKQYLLGTSNICNNIQKSGSASMLDSKLKSFHSNISEHQKLLNPTSPSISPTMQAIIKPKLATIESKDEKETMVDKYKHICCLNAQKSDSETDAKLGNSANTDSPNTAVLSNHSNLVSSQTDDTTAQTIKPNDTEIEPDNIQEVSIIVPEIPWNNNNRTSSTSFDDDVDTDSLSSFDENLEKQYHELSHSSSTADNLTVPKVQINDGSEDIEDMTMDSLLIIEEKQTPKTPDTKFEWTSPRNSEPKVLNQPKMLEQNVAVAARATLDVGLKLRRKSSSDLSSSGSARDVTAAALTETELSDWARDENVSDDLEDVEMKIDYQHFDTKRKSKEPKFKNKVVSAVNSHFVKLGDLDHICGKNVDQRNLNNDVSNPNPTNP